MAARFSSYLIALRLILSYFIDKVITLFLYDLFYFGDVTNDIYLTGVFYLVGATFLGCSDFEALDIIESLFILN